MCGNEANIQQIAHDISGIRQHLAKINGRLDKVEDTVHTNEKEIAVTKARCQLVTHYTDEEVKRILSDQQVQENRLLEFLKGNAVQLGEVSALVFLIGKISGWW